MSQRLDDVISEFVNARLSQGMAPNTVRNERRALDKLLLQLGPIQVRNITEAHVDAFFAGLQGKGQSMNTLNVNLSGLRSFFAFTDRRGYTRRNPVAHRRAFRGMPRERLRIPADQFPRLLDCAGHPRDRMLIAVGLFLWLRESEATDLRVSDVDLASGEVAVRVFKTKQLDRMPISLELDAELRRWLQNYTLLIGRPLEPDMRLIPARGTSRVQDAVTGRFKRVDYGRDHLRPSVQLARPARIVHSALIKLGYPTHDPVTGKSLMEGMHTLRRSGARARYDYLVDDGYDGALREVQAGLHHSSTKQTERYIGLTLDYHRRSKNIKGRSLYGYTVGEGNVVELKVGDREQTDDHRDVV